MTSEDARNQQISFLEDIRSYLAPLIVAQLQREGIVVLVVNKLGHVEIRQRVKKEVKKNAKR